MDSSIISIIVAVVIGGVITLAEKWINRPASGSSATAPKRPARPPQAFAAAPAPAVTQPEPPKATPKAATPKRPKRQPEAPAPTLFTEGSRVTADEPIEAPAPEQPARSALPPMPGNDLRSAVIWSEILRRKF